MGPKTDKTQLKRLRAGAGIRLRQQLASPRPGRIGFSFGPQDIDDVANSAALYLAERKIPLAKASDDALKKALHEAVKEWISKKKEINEQQLTPVQEGQQISAAVEALFGGSGVAIAAQTPEEQLQAKQISKAERRRASIQPTFTTIKLTDIYLDPATPPAQSAEAAVILLHQGEAPSNLVALLPSRHRRHFTGGSRSPSFRDIARYHRDPASVSSCPTCKKIVLALFGQSRADPTLTRNVEQIMTRYIGLVTEEQMPVKPEKD